MTDQMKDSSVQVSLDRILPFQVDALDVRGRMVQLSQTITSIIQQHDYPDAVNRLLAESVALTALLGSSLKLQGKFILQVQSQGPVNVLVVDFVAPDSIRAYLRFDDAALAKAIEAGHTAPEQLLGNGHLVMTIDQGEYMNRYQGVVALEGQSLEQAAHNYFMQSEQLPTLVRLAASEVIVPGEERSKWFAAGIMVQYLPEASANLPHRDLHPGDDPNVSADDQDAAHLSDKEASAQDAWREAEALIGTIADQELADPSVSSETLLYRLFHENGPRVYEAQDVKHQCSCNREKIVQMLNNFKEDELQDMIVDGKIDVTCEFCSAKYHFCPSELKA